MGKRLKLGEMLVAKGLVSDTQLAAALGEQRRWGKRLGMTLVLMGYLEEEMLIRTLAAQLKLPVARIRGKRVNAEVIELVPVELAEKHRCLPLFVKDQGGSNELFLAMEDPSDLDAQGELGFRIGFRIRPVLVAPTELEDALQRHYHWAAVAGGASPPLAPIPARVKDAAPMPLAEKPEEPFEDTEPELHAAAAAAAAADDRGARRHPAGSARHRARGRRAGRLRRTEERTGPAPRAGRSGGARCARRGRCHVARRDPARAHAAPGREGRALARRAGRAAARAGGEGSERRQASLTPPRAGVTLRRLAGEAEALPMRLDYSFELSKVEVPRFSVEAVEGIGKLFTLATLVLNVLESKPVVEIVFHGLNPEDPESKIEAFREIITGSDDARSLTFEFGKGGRVPGSSSSFRWLKIKA